jgi:hypothetical protein
MSSITVIVDSYVLKFTFFEHIVKTDKSFRLFSIMPFKTEDLNKEELGSRIVLTTKEFNDFYERVMDTVKNRYDEQYLTITYSLKRRISIARKDDNWFLTVKDESKEMSTTGYVNDLINMYRFIEDFKLMFV